MRRVRVILGVPVILALAGAAVLPLMRSYWSWREENPIRRGARLAHRAGCLSCHGPEGSKGLPDPNGGEVPVWDGGVPMMYVSGVHEVREYIEDGVSKRRSTSASARAERAKAAIRMPAYRGVLTPRQIDDLVAYFAAASRLGRLDDPVAEQGRGLVGRFRCEACHGVGGSGGVGNPGSFKGYVPGWLGADFADLVRDEGELRAWIRDGGIERFAHDPLATYFLTRQRLQMPAYRQALSDEESGAMVAYIKSLRPKR
jgi:mono/diheme cytochrome c family protein